jgi:hypothetical protein
MFFPQIDYERVYNTKGYFHYLTTLVLLDPCVVMGEKISPTVTHACSKRQLKWVLSAWGYNWATQSPGDINMEAWSSRLEVGLMTPPCKKSTVRKPKM